MPGEGAGALLVGAAGGTRRLVCTGIGFASEAAHIEVGEPLRADGLSQAIKDALADAGCEMHDIDFRITDISGEQYYFKEAALALSAHAAQRKEEFESGTRPSAPARPGARRHASSRWPTPRAQGLREGAAHPGHMANDAGQRAALSLQYRAAA